ncbi:RDD family protein [Paenibacillus sp. Marseille-Q4541]|uniref:RDD family protein n=1 Tax=Paenibacillus sp. Marseille-Q4541 TaxID=2831522 RepID=UPI001BAB06C9
MSVVSVVANEPAGFWIRLGANILDGLILSIPLSILSWMITGSGDENVVTETITFLYILLLPVFWNGYTVGKYICGIKIRKVGVEDPPGIVNMLLRVIIGNLVYAFTFGIGTIVSVCMVAFREDKRSLHDFIAGTEVVRN